MCLVFVRNYTGMMVVRAILGLCEGGLVPGIVSRELMTRATADVRKVLYFAEIYTRGEMALRLGLFHTAASISGAFGGSASLNRMANGAHIEKFLGLLARGLTAIGKRGAQTKWTWIFIIEGLLVCIPSFLDRTRDVDNIDRYYRLHGILCTP